MDILIPLHQFEVRYTPILDFATVSKTIIAPFVKMATSISIEDELGHAQKINLRFDLEGYTISVWWDRIFLRSDKGYEKLKQPNSPLESPFLTILDKIKSISSFGQVNQTIFYTVGVKITTDKTIKEITSEFKQRFFTSNITEICSANDFGISLDQQLDTKLINSNFGPYNGIAELRKRGIPFNDTELYDKPGTMMVLNITNVTSTVTLKDYKEASGITEKMFSAL